MVGISPNHVGVMERGETMPSLETVSACASAFGVPIGELIDGETPGDGWLKQLVTIAQSVTPSKRPLLLHLVTGLVVALCRAEGEEEQSSSLAIKTAKANMNTLLADQSGFQPDDPKILVIVEMLRARTPGQVEQALYVIKALGSE